MSLGLSEYIPFVCMHENCTLTPGSHAYMTFQGRAWRFFGPSTVTPVFFKVCSQVCLVFSAVSRQPCVPSLAIGGRGKGEVGWGVWGPGCWTLAGIPFDLSQSSLAPMSNDPNWTHIRHLQRLFGPVRRSSSSVQYKYSEEFMFCILDGD